MGDRRTQRRAVGREINPATSGGLQLLDRCEYRLRLHYHPGAPAKRAIVSRLVFIQRPSPQIVDSHRQISRGDALPQDALGEKAIKHAREQREDVDRERHEAELSTRRTGNRGKCRHKKAPDYSEACETAREPSSRLS